MRRSVLAGAAAALAVAAPAAAARIADYSLTEAQFEALAAKLGVEGFRAAPGKGDVDVVVEAPAIDHRTRVLGISCTAWNVDNPISQMVKRALAAWDRDGGLSAPSEPRALVTVRLESGSSNMRCVQVKELKMRCLLRASLAGSATIERPGSPARTEPVLVEVEQEQKMAGFCNGMAQGTSLLGRTASLALIDKLQALAAAD
ncbi:MAG TPA: hypothetical protein VE891_01610 [Allosphingosinicella sp.]|nr:hypothetical protein [Allosphingosinicella sp.]